MMKMTVMAPVQTARVPTIRAGANAIEIGQGPVEMRPEWAIPVRSRPGIMRGAMLEESTRIEAVNFASAAGTARPSPAVLAALVKALP